MKSFRKIAVITGATSGLGWEFAIQINNNYKLDEIWIIGRRKKRLEKLAKKLKNSKAVQITANLSKDTGLAKISSRLKTHSPDVVFLVNNAGMSKSGNFSELSLDEIKQIMDVNIRAVAQITHFTLPYMKEGSSILQVASIVGFFPFAGAALYSASKAFVLSLSCSLQRELYDKKIHCIAVCPGPVSTEFIKVSSRGKFKQFKQFSRAYGADDVVATALKDSRKKRLISIHGYMVKIIPVLIRIFPRKWLMFLFYKGRNSRAFKK